MRVWSSVLVLLLLAACGTGSGEPGTSPTSSAPTAGTSSSPVDLTGVDACSLLDQATVQGLTGESARFVTQDVGQGREIGCFWGAAEPGVPAYVELTAAPRSTGLDAYAFPPGCIETPVPGVGTEAKGAMCAGDPHLKVRLVVWDQGVLVTLLVNEPNRPLEPDDLAAALEAVAAALG